MEKNKEISNEKYGEIKKYLGKFSYIDLVVWRNEMITSGNINSRLFNLLNTEILNRACEVDLHKKKDKSK